MSAVLSERARLLQLWMCEQFDEDSGAFRGPPRAYFELLGRRGIYKVWALIGRESQIDELEQRFRDSIADLRARGGVTLFLRRDVQLTVDDKSSDVMLSARYCVWDADGNEVPWAQGSEREDGMPSTLLLAETI